MASTEKTVLVVDDEESVRAVAAKLIEKRGHAVLVASNGSQALELLRSGRRIDLLVLDVVMPELDGLQTLEQIRAGHHDVPVILLTAQTKDEDVLGGYRRGADYYVTKPLKPAELLNIVDYLIGDLPPEQKARLEALL